MQECSMTVVSPKTMLRCLILPGIFLIVLYNVADVTAEGSLLSEKVESAVLSMSMDRWHIFRRRAPEKNPPRKSEKPKKKKNPKEGLCPCCDQKIGCHLDGSYGTIFENICSQECPNCYRDCMNYYNNGAHPCPGGGPCD
ncbi:unnamed protein product [Bemisia tabaci]|uniref:Uncharacterized protein n=3 Tax=Bemisia tabaci TaxID=7038 RepID=A0A9P0CBJ7_BEMTA|nr:unnamed protein product [Bemisia tabaci]